MFEGNRRQLGLGGTFSRGRLCVLCVFACFFAAACEREAADLAKPVAIEAPKRVERPALIVLISLDTVRADHLGVYGYPRATSPHLDALARDGVVFEDVSATSPWTLPSHATMMTGLFPARHGVVANDTRLSRRTETLAERLARSGYETYAVVNTPWLQRDVFGFMRGFEQTLFVKGGGDRVAPNTLVTDTARGWLERKSRRPKFIFVHYIDAHSDYVSLPEHEARFVAPYEGPVVWTTNALFRLRVSDSFISSCQDDPGAQACLDHEGQSVVDAMRPGALGAAQLEHMLDRYDAGIHQLDAELGRLFEAIDGAVDREAQLVMVTSDHGEEFMEHGSVFHAARQYEEVLRVPLIARGLGLPRGLRVDVPVSLVDLAPTLVEVARGRALPGIDGRSLVPLWSDGDRSGFAGRPLYGEAPGEYGEVLGPRHYVSVRRGTLKLHREESTGQLELYDLALDPRETRNVAADHPGQVAELVALLDAHQGRNTASESERVELSEEDRRALRALGYLEE